MFNNLFLANNQQVILFHTNLKIYLFILAQTKQGPKFESSLVALILIFTGEFCYNHPNTYFVRKNPIGYVFNSQSTYTRNKLIQIFISKEAIIFITAMLNGWSMLTWNPHGWESDKALIDDMSGCHMNNLHTINQGLSCQCGKKQIRTYQCGMCCWQLPCQQV